jgi:hypothetical protein
MEKGPKVIVFSDKLEFVFEEKEKFINKVNQIFSTCSIDAWEKKHLRFQINPYSPFIMEKFTPRFLKGAIPMPVSRFTLYRTDNSEEVSEVEVYMERKKGQIFYGMDSFTFDEYRKRNYNNMLRAIFIMSAKHIALVIPPEVAGQGHYIFTPDIVGSLVVSEFSGSSWKNFGITASLENTDIYAAPLNEELYNRAKKYFKELMTKGTKGDCKETDELIKIL